MDVKMAYQNGDLFRFNVHKVSTGAAYDDLETSPVKAGEFLIVNHVSCENETTAYTNLRIGVKSGAAFDALEEEKSPAVDEVYWTKNVIYVREHERLCARFTGCTSGDSLNLSIQGMLCKMGVISNV